MCLFFRRATQSDILKDIPSRDGQSSEDMMTQLSQAAQRAEDNSTYLEKHNLHQYIDDVFTQKTFKQNCFRITNCINQFFIKCFRLLNFIFWKYQKCIRHLGYLVNVLAQQKPRCPKAHIIKYFVKQISDPEQLKALGVRLSTATDLPMYVWKHSQQTF